MDARDRVAVRSRSDGRAQPRPALGRRPWFAFLRRARSLRRFALAMRTGRVPARGSRAIPGPVRLVAVGPSGRLWSRSDVVVLRSARAGRRGLIPAAAGRSVLLGGPAVHGFGMSETLAVTGVDGAGRILETRQLRPRRLVWVRGARWLIEQPIADAPPPAGALLSVRVPGHAGDRPFLT